MGAYLIYKLEDSRKAIRANNWLDKQEEQQELCKFRRGLGFWDKRDRDIELNKVKETGHGDPDYKKIGEGDWKASGFDDDDGVCSELVSRLFEKLHKAFVVQVYSGSCALSLDYFSMGDLKIITKNGEALTGKYKEEKLKLLNGGLNGR